MVALMNFNDIVTAVHNNTHWQQHGVSYSWIIVVLCLL